MAITATSFTANGTITATGGENEDERGVVYSTTTHGAPGNVAPASSGYEGLVNETGGSFTAVAFTEEVTGRASNTQYFMRAYAHNRLGYAYGGEVSVTTLVAVVDTPLTPAVGALTLVGQAGDKLPRSLRFVGGTPIVQTAAPTQDTPLTPFVGALTIAATVPQTDRGPIPAGGVLTLAGQLSVTRTATALLPATGALALTPGAPAPSGSMAPATGTLALVGLAPVAKSATALAPAVGALALTPIAPVLGGAVGLAPAAGSLSFVRATFAPQVPVGALALTGSQPTLDLGAPSNTPRTPFVGALTLAGGQGAAGQYVVCQPATGALTWGTDSGPTVPSDMAVTSVVGALALTPIAGLRRVDTRLMTAAAAGGANLVLASGAPSIGGATTLTPARAVLRLGSAPVQTTTVIPARGVLRIGSLAVNIVMPTTGALLIASGTEITPGGGELVIGDYIFMASAAALGLTGTAVDVAVPAVQNLDRTPLAGALAATGQASTLSRSVTPAAGTLTATGSTPQLGGKPTPLVAALAVTGDLPTVRVAVSLQPLVGALALTATAIIPAVDRSRLTLVGALTLAGVLGKAGRGQVPLIGSLTLTGTQPALLTPLALRPLVGALALTGGSPTGGTVRTTVVGALALTGAMPITGRAAEPLPAALTLEAGEAAVAPTPCPGTATLALEGIEPTVHGQPPPQIILPRRRVTFSPPTRLTVAVRIPTRIVVRFATKDAEDLAYV